MQLPIPLLNSLEGIKGYDREAFLQVHTEGGQITSIRLNPLKPESNLFPDTNIISGGVPWSRFGFYLSGRPSFTFDPFFHAGCYYVQEASSMFLEQALIQNTDILKPLKVLDLCASPGGKSTHLQSLLPAGSVLVSNEVIKSRANILKDNLIKWGGDNVVVTNNDPRDFARLPGYFDVIVVDAPCSGSGLFRRDPDAVSEWSENAVQLCAQRQQRILSDVLPALKEGGLLIYSTCSYSKEEDEEINNWLQLQYAGMENDNKLTPVRLNIKPEWNIIESGSGYRFWPYKVKGEGFYLACFQKTGSEGAVAARLKSKPNLISKNESDVLHDWIKSSGYQFVKFEPFVYAWPEILVNDFNLLAGAFRVIYSGVRAGEIVRDKLIPDHALALSLHASGKIGKIELTYIDAIKYLQRKDISVRDSKTGWHLATYKGHPLGWMNILPARINNYYPKELRILKEFPSS